MVFSARREPGRRGLLPRFLLAGPVPPPDRIEAARADGLAEQRDTQSGQRRAAATTATTIAAFATLAFFGRGSCRQQNQWSRDRQRKCKSELSCHIKIIPFECVEQSDGP